MSASVLHRKRVVITVVTEDAKVLDLEGDYQTLETESIERS